MRIGRERRRIGIRKFRPEEPGVELQRRPVRSVWSVDILVREGAANVACGGRRQRFEARGPADLVRNRDVDGFAGDVLLILRRRARTGDNPTGVVAEVLIIVAVCLGVGDQVDVIADGSQHCDLLREIEACAVLLRHENGLVHAQAPAPGSEPHGHGVTVRPGGPILVQETIQYRQANSDGNAAYHASQHSTSGQLAHIFLSRAVKSIGDFKADSK